ncbi:DUF1439 domain-containing protein [Shewanella sp. NIFS-20-20]|uniref:DUF1439 domain-containing protein n=1 Tax=Shewanella sp. NIFS-20-20 TaxID=2853806 RepID=UPI001C4819C8|nr:DUF1439 domain-containing protein [Shewanella sp. NIFS-20-20]MBV7315378.1 DUF1439 domain-containing protein [Shewanella sp. NIFS-20-20]
MTLKRLLAGVGLICTSLLTGCASQYSISQNELTDYLNKEMTYEVKQGNQFIGTLIKLNRVQVLLGETPDTMKVITASQVEITNPLLPLRATLNASFEAVPWYDNQSHSIYLRNLRLVDVSSTPQDIDKIVKDIGPQIMGFVSGFLETQPVYVLNQDDSHQAWAAKLVDKMEVKPGKLVFVFK